MGQQGDNQLVHHGTVIGKVAGNTDFCIVSDGNYTVHAYDAQGTTNVGDKVQIFKQNSTYYVGAKIS
jgi:hypothetical protein